MLKTKTSLACGWLNTPQLTKNAKQAEFSNSDEQSNGIKGSRTRWDAGKDMVEGRVDNLRCNCWFTEWLHVHVCVCDCIHTCVVAAGERQQLPMQPSAVNACACVCVLCHCNRSNYIWPIYHFGIADVDLITGLGAAPTEWSTMRVTIRCRWWAASHKCATSAKDKPSCSKQASIHIYEHKHTTSKYIYIYTCTYTHILLFEKSHFQCINEK